MSTRKRGNVKKAKQKVPKTAELELLSAKSEVEKLLRDLSVKRRLERRLIREIRFYDGLCAKEKRLQRENFRVLEKATSEIEVILNVHYTQFMTWVNQRNSIIAMCEQNMDDIHGMCMKQVQLKDDERTQKVEELCKVVEFRNAKDKLINELLETEKTISVSKVFYFIKRRLINGKYNGEFEKCRDEFMELLNNAVDKLKDTVVNDGTWIVDVIEQTSRMTSYVKDFEERAHRLMLITTMLKRGEKLIEEQIAAKSKVVDQLVSNVVEGQKLIDEQEKALREISISDTVEESFSENEVLKIMVKRQQQKVKIAKDRYNAKEETYHQLLDRVKRMSMNDIHVSFQALEQKIETARQFIKTDIRSPLVLLPHYIEKERNLIPPLLTLLETTDIYHGAEFPSNRPPKHMTIDAYVRQKAYFLGRMGIIFR